MANRGIKTKVSLIKTSDRATGIKRAVELLGINPVKGKDVLLKPNFNTADPFPASTHNDTLSHLIFHLKNLGAKKMTCQYDLYIIRKIIVLNHIFLLPLFPIVFRLL